MHLHRFFYPFDFMKNRVLIKEPEIVFQIRKVLDKSEKFLSGVKAKKFDEKEIRNLLYDVPNEIKTYVPSSSIESYKDGIENRFIKVEDPRENLEEAYVLGYHKREEVIKVI